MVNDLNQKGINPIIIGDGSRIIKQYPKKGSKIVKGDKVLLLTNSTNYKMIYISNWSRIDVSRYCSVINIECIYNGYGYVTEQSIPIGSSLNENSKLEVKLENRDDKK